MIAPNALFLALFFIQSLGDCAHYEANWTSIDSRPLPNWYDEAKLGIFLHWGVFSVPSLQSEWFWKDWKDGQSKEINEYMDKYYPKDFTYQEFAKDFTAAFFNATQWAELFKNAGAKYVVLTSKHHDGFTLWPSKYSYSWNSVDVGPKRDLVGELAQAVRSQNLTFGVYHSLFEWYNPLWLSDKEYLYFKHEFVDNKVIPEMKELINAYQPAVLWSDGDWDALDIYWKSKEFIAWLYNESPVKDIIVTNDRWGVGTNCKHGGVYTCQDRYNPGVLQAHKWENAMTLDTASWGFRRNAKLSDYYDIQGLLKELVTTVSCGGNLLINVGPTMDGIITPIFEERLLQLGRWMEINGEAIYGTKPWRLQNDTVSDDVWYTSKGSTVYAIILSWRDQVTISPVELFTDSGSKVVLLGNNGALKWTVVDNGIKIILPNKAMVKSEWSYVLRITTGSKILHI